VLRRQQARLHQVHVRINAARRRNVAKSIDWCGGRANEQIGVIDNVRITGASYTHDETIFDPDIRFHKAQHRIDDEHVGDEEIELTRGR